MTHGASRTLGRIAGGVSHHAYFVVAIWIALAAGLNVAVPQLEKVVAEEAGPFIPDSAPSLVTLQNMGVQFGESQSTAIGYLVFENNGGLSESDHHYYRDIVAKLQANHSKIDSVQDLIGDPATAALGASQDGKAVYAVVRFYGGMGSAAQLRGQDFTQELLDQNPAPPGLKTYLTGPAPTIGEEIKSEDRAVLLITGLSVIMIVALLLLVYRSVITIIVPLATVGLALAVSRPIVAMLATSAGLDVSIFSVMLLAALILGGGTDYAVFLISGYHEHRREGMSYHDSVVASSSKIVGVIVASGLTVAASCAVMAFTHIVLFRTVGLPCSIGVVVAVLAAVTLVPALTSIFGRHGFMDPKQPRQPRFWRRWGVWVVRRARHQPGGEPGHFGRVGGPSSVDVHRLQRTSDAVEDDDRQPGLRRHSTPLRSQRAHARLHRRRVRPRSAYECRLLRAEHDRPRNFKGPRRQGGSRPHTA